MYTNQPTHIFLALQGKLEFDYINDVIDKTGYNIFPEFD